MQVNVENLMKTAFEEMENGQYEEASKHFDMVVVNDASNMEAPLFRAYCNCYNIKLIEIPNASVAFANAFCRYVDAVKSLQDPEAERQKLDYAVGLLTTLVSNFQLNAKRTMLLTPSTGLSISTAATTMNSTCKEKLKNTNAIVSENVLSSNEDQATSNKKISGWLLVLIALGVFAFILFLIW